MTEQELQNFYIFRDQLRQAVANYMNSEGCSCCSDHEQHNKDTAALAELLNVEKHSDGYGYNFHKFITKHVND